MLQQQILTTLKQYRQLLPILLLTTYCISAIIAAINGTIVIEDKTFDFDLTIKHYVAFGIVIINFLTYFLKRELYKYLLALTITIGLFNLITFSALETTVSYALNSFQISFQPSAFWAGLLAYFINFKKVNEFIIGSLTIAQSAEEQSRNEKIRFSESVENFKDKYECYSDETLTEIVTTNKYVPEALEAARQLLNERQTIENLH